jgi:hypothetical protein
VVDRAQGSTWQGEGVCAFGWDFELLFHGDRTIVREKGVTLSGGEKVTSLRD